MNYEYLSDCLWYVGHITTGISIFYIHSNYYVAISIVLFSQACIIISRPISNIDNKKHRIKNYTLEHPEIYDTIVQV